MNKKEVLDVNTFLKGLESARSENILFAYGINKNIKATQDEVDSLKKVIEPFETAKNDLVFKFYKKDDKGNVVMKGNQPEFTDYSKLEEELNTLIKEHEKLLKDYENLLLEESDIELYKMPIEALENIFVFKNGEKVKISLSPKEFNILQLMIK